MVLTRDFKDTVVARAQRDPRFREMLFTEAINAYLGGDTVTGKAILRDLVNATARQISVYRQTMICEDIEKSLERLENRGNR